MPLELCRRPSFKNAVPRMSMCLLQSFGGVFVVIALSQSFIRPVNSSLGDRSYVYHVCMQQCSQNILFCQHRTHSTKPKREIPVAYPYSDSPAKPWDSWPVWSCERECSYHCTWTAVQAFRRDKVPVPQFHGRWPFVRILGIQEPASALFSLLNLVSHVVMIWRFLCQVPAEAPMRNLWLVYSFFSCNAWVSSTIFHCYDVPITEKMDYFGALAFLLSSLFMAIVRVFHHTKPLLSTRVLSCIAVVFCAFFVYHTSYLSFVRFDYGYNMAVNITVGVLNGLLWVTWCGVGWKQWPHGRYCVAVILIMQGLVLLELFDFPPLWWTLDAHAIWHGGTVLLAVWWYKFVIADCIFLLKSSRIALIPETLKVE